MEKYNADAKVGRPTQEGAEVSIFAITQATAALFTDLYFSKTYLFYIQQGTKHFQVSGQKLMRAKEGDLIIFPPSSVVTIENRPVRNADYRALGLSFSHDLTDAVFADMPWAKIGIQIVRPEASEFMGIVELARDTIENTALPPVIRRHRSQEPLIWLREQGVQLPVRHEDHPMNQVRRLVETDLSHPWRIDEVAHHFCMSEATLRRWLSKSGNGFAKILLHARLEHGLGLLQMTDAPISQIALDCGFKTPSHFSSVFSKRFGINPKAIRHAEV